MKTKITTVTITDTISRDLKFKLQIATETILCEAMAKWGTEEGGSSRVLADDIVDMIVGVLDGSKPLPSGDQLAPWKAFAIKK
jgi:hypothetical protein